MRKFKFLNKETVKWVVRLLTTIGFAIFCYLFFSLFLDTPIEYELKKSTQRLENEYERLAGKLDSLNEVLVNLEQRDKSIYKIIFEAEPYTQAEDTLSSSFETYERLMGMTNKEMGDEFMGRVGQLYQVIYNLDSKNEQMQNYFADNRELLNKIPSIQPVYNPNLKLLATSFGDRIHPFYKSMSHHAGVDYAVPAGTAVFATADGEVSQIQTRGNASGLSLEINHDNNYKTTYAHLDKVLVKVGNRVNRGDIIAISGNSGLSYAPHLHYEVKHNGKAVDPLNYFFMELDIDKTREMEKVARTGMQSFD